MTSGRVYVLGQVLAREHERSTALEQQLQQRTQEIERLRGEMTQLQQRENDLRAALDRALSTSATAGKPSAGRSAVATNDSTTSAPTDPAPEPARASEERRHQEIERQHTVMIARLQTALGEEHQRREQVETQLARLKEETSTPPYAQPGAADPELTAAKEQVMELRTALEEERAARERLAEDFQSLQQRAAAESAGKDNTNSANSELQLRLQQLQQEKESLTQSFNRSLAESQQKADNLEQQLTAAHARPIAPDGADGDLASVRSENTALRSRLDEEHRRTEELAAKLKVAMRVTDLIFKMQAQQAPSRY